MSNTEPNLERSARWHRGPIVGISLAVIFAVGAFIWWLTYEVVVSTPPEGAPVQIDGRTGESSETDPTTTIPAAPEAEIPAETVQ